MRIRPTVLFPVLGLAIAACMARGPGATLSPPTARQPAPAIEVEGVATGPAAREASGMVVLNIRWPRRTQAIPQSTQAIAARVLAGGTLIADFESNPVQVTVTRPSDDATSSVRLEVPPGGPYELDVRAYDDLVLHNDETMVASGSTTFSMRSNERVALKVVLVPRAVPTPTPGPSATPVETPGPEPTPVPTPTPLAGTPTPAPTPQPTPTPDALPTPSPTPVPTPTPVATPTPSPTPSFTSVYMAPANSFVLYLPATDGQNTAGLPTSQQLHAIEFGTDATVSASLFTWTSSDEAVAVVSAGGQVTPVAASAQEVTITAEAKHNADIKTSATVRVKAAGRIELEID